MPCANPLVRTNEKNRWQDVACCIEHGAEYFAQVAKSRSKITTVEKKEKDIPVEQVDSFEATEVITEVEEVPEEATEVKTSKKKR